MHDLTYANRILDRLKKEAGKKEKSALVTIEVYLSPLSHVTPRRLKDVFGLLLKGEGFNNVVLNVNVSEISAHCRKCGKTWKSKKPTFECPKCKNSYFELDHWEEFYIESIKFEK